MVGETMDMNCVIEEVETKEEPVSDGEDPFSLELSGPCDESGLYTEFTFEDGVIEVKEEDTNEDQEPVSLKRARSKNTGLLINKDKKSESKRKKKNNYSHPCLFCGQFQFQLKRHLYLKHKNEDEVIKMAASSDKNSEFTKLQLLGDNKHNLKIKCEGKGRLIVARRVQGNKLDSEYLPCTNCKGWFSKSYLSIHVRKLCKQRTTLQSSPTLTGTGLPSNSDKDSRERSDRKFTDHNHPCLFCGQFKFNLKRHLYLKHKDEEEVIKMKTSSDKNSEFTKLRLLGDHKHNLKVKSEGKGQLIVARSDGDKPDSEYIPCINCKAWFSKSNLYKHTSKFCRHRSLSKPHPTIRSGHNLLLTCKLSNELKIILENMINDPPGIELKQDPLVHRYLTSEGITNTPLNMPVITQIRKTLRYAGHFLCKSRGFDEEGNLESILKPSKIKKIVDIMNEVVCKDGKMQRWRIGDAIKTLLKVLLELFIQNNETEKVEEIINLQKLIDQEWSKQVPIKANQIVDEEKDVTESTLTTAGVEELEATTRRSSRGRVYSWTDGSRGSNKM